MYIVFTFVFMSNKIVSYLILSYLNNDLVTFYKKCVYGKHPNLEQHVRKMVSLSGGTCCCEQFFSRMKFTKRRYRSQLTCEHLTS